MGFNKSEYDQEYNSRNIKRKFIPFNIQNPDDMEMLEWLATKGNVTQYVKQLIKADIECSRCLEREYCDKCGFDGLS